MGRLVRVQHHLPLETCPPTHRPRRTRVDVHVPHPPEAVWRWLCDPATFTGGQVWPYRVEFLDPVTGADAGFQPGVLTNHHGPLLNAAGVIGEVRAPAYRDLAYTYGAYVISPRICRPVRLQMALADAGPVGTTVTITVDLQVRRGLGRLVDAVQRRFWRRFGTWADRAIRRA